MVPSSRPENEPGAFPTRATLPQFVPSVIKSGAISRAKIAPNAITETPGQKALSDAIMLLTRSDEFVRREWEARG